jgi:hypothetical protein
MAAAFLRGILFNTLFSIVYAFLTPIPVIQKARSSRVLSLRLSGSTEQEFASVAAVHMPKNVLGGTIQCCCVEPKTGFFRDGFCTTGSINALINFEYNAVFFFCGETKSAYLPSQPNSLPNVKQVQRIPDSTLFAHR